MFDKFGRPNWDSFFLAQAFLVAQRSIDPHTKHGCIAVSQDKTILSVGYNGFPRGCNDSNYPLTRPDKYLVMNHAETNCITNAAREGVSLKDANFYITGRPCLTCFSLLAGLDTKKVVFGNVSSKMLNKNMDKYNRLMEKLSSDKGIILRCIDDPKLPEIIEKTLSYMKRFY